ncbi:MAG: lipoprotein insertase outer membrane protein LolB [Gammaproteobacteria bacterium]|nr:lipoprotein insertase outer membrane protein LolB [Gammaproteobacteria bacterium]
MIRRSIQLPSIRPPHVALLFWIILFQAGCTSTPLNSTPGLALSTSMDWALHGKMALRSDRGNANMQIHWQQHSDAYDIHLLGPLGQVAAHVYGRGDALQIDIAGQSREENAGEIDVIEDALGWDIPIKEMSFWVRGLPVPGLVHEIAYDNQGLSEWLVQSGWRVEYQKYKRRKPVRTTFSRDSVKILLVVKEWRLNDTR